MLQMLLRALLGQVSILGAYRFICANPLRHGLADSAFRWRGIISTGLIELHIRREEVSMEGCGRKETLQGRVFQKDAKEAASMSLTGANIVQNTGMEPESKPDWCK
jgi:hypothetical protein